MFYVVVPELSSGKVFYRIELHGQTPYETFVKVVDYKSDKSEAQDFCDQLNEKIEIQKRELKLKNNNKYLEFVTSCIDFLRRG